MWTIPQKILLETDKRFRELRRSLNVPDDPEDLVNYYAQLMRMGKEQDIIRLAALGDPIAMKLFPENDLWSVTHNLSNKVGEHEDYEFAEMIINQVIQIGVNKVRELWETGGNRGAVTEDHISSLESYYMVFRELSDNPDERYRFANDIMDEQAPNGRLHVRGYYGQLEKLMYSIPVFMVYSASLRMYGFKSDETGRTVPRILRRVLNKASQIGITARSTLKPIMDRLRANLEQ